MSAVRCFITALALTIFQTLSAQTATDYNMGASMAVDGSSTPPTWRFSWWGRTGRHYLVQVTIDLQTWSFLPATNPSGADATITVVVPIDYDPAGAGGNAQEPKLFFRAVEIDPSRALSSASDADGNGLPDLWEKYHFGQTGNNPDADTNGDAVSLRVKCALGLNPAVAATTDTASQTHLKVFSP